MITLEQYQIINQSFKKTLVFHFGAFAGFYSEYNNMLKAIAFCLVHKIRFVLYSKDALFCKGNGWKDLFLPFTDEVEDDFHHILNVRTPQKATQTAFFRVFIKRRLKRIIGRDTAPVSWSLYNNVFKNRRIKCKYGFDYFTYDLWEDIVHICLSTRVTINGFFSGSYYELIQEINRIIWHYNEETRIAINQVTQRLSLPDEFIGLHIRGGDKIVEATLLGWQEYVSAAIRFECKNWFIFTDDYSIIESIRNSYPDHSVYTLCQPEDRGYFHHSVMAENESIKREKIIRMLASVDILKKAYYFIGTNTSNPFFVIDLEHDGKNCLSLDSKMLY